MNQCNRKHWRRVLLGAGVMLLLTSASISFAAEGLRLMPANIEIFGEVESIDSIKGVVKVRGRLYRFAPEMRIHKIDGTTASWHNMRLKKGMKISIRHSAPKGRKTYIAEEVWVKK